MPSLNQASFLMQMAKELPVPPEYLESERLWTTCSTMTDGEYKKMLALIYNKKTDEAAKMLQELTLFTAKV